MERDLANTVYARAEECDCSLKITVTFGHSCFFILGDIGSFISVWIKALVSDQTGKSMFHHMCKICKQVWFFCELIDVGVIVFPVVSLLLREVFWDHFCTHFGMFI